MIFFLLSRCNVLPVPRIRPHRHGCCLPPDHSFWNLPRRSGSNGCDTVFFFLSFFHEAQSIFFVHIIIFHDTLCLLWLVTTDKKWIPCFRTREGLSRNNVRLPQKTLLILLFLSGNQNCRFATFCSSELFSPRTVRYRKRFHFSSSYASRSSLLNFSLLQSLLTGHGHTVQCHNHQQVSVRLHDRHFRTHVLPK